MPRLGVITIGQSPRSDIMPYMKSLLDPEVEVVEAGALDGLDSEELRAMAPGSGDHSLVTRLADGNQIVISHDKVLPQVQKRIDLLNQEGVDIILLLCTGTFPAFESKALIIESQRIVDHTLEAVLGPERTLGVFVPLPEQAEHSAQKLKHITPNVVAVSASPYMGAEQMRAAAREMARHKPDLTVLHCMGYNETHREILTSVLDTPSMVANSMVARTLAELLKGKAMAATA